MRLLAFCSWEVYKMPCKTSLVTVTGDVVVYSDFFFQVYHFVVIFFLWAHDSIVVISARMSL